MVVKNEELSLVIDLPKTATAGSQPLLLKYLRLECHKRYPPEFTELVYQLLKTSAVQDTNSWKQHNKQPEILFHQLYVALSNQHV